VVTLPTDHFIAQLALQIDADGRRAVGTAPVRPELFVPGTERIRTALLATLVDVVAGHAPAGPIGPTVDLRLQMLAAPPRDGVVHLESTPLRVGRRLVVADTVLRAGPAGEAFARATTTFMNVAIPGDGIGAEPPQLHPTGEPSFDVLLPLIVLDGQTVEADPNPRLMIQEGTVVQGGA
jgi:acyl-coenzyme A thioesterase PaaI-like protein